MMSSKSVDNTGATPFPGQQNADPSQDCVVPSIPIASTTAPTLQNSNTQPIHPLSWDQLDVVLVKPEDVTPQFLNLLLLRQNGDDRKVPLVKAVHLVGKVSAILSEVMEMAVEYDDAHRGTNDSSSSATELMWLPIQLVIKFIKPTITMTQDMFRVEGNFYQHMTVSCHGHPFWIPRALYCSPTCIMLEKVEHVAKYNLLESCPTDRLYPVIVHLAQFHAFHWKDSSMSSSSTSSLSSPEPSPEPSSYSWPFPNLSPTAGMGASMAGPDKARFFSENFTTFCQDLLLKQQLVDIPQQSLDDLGQQLCESSSAILAIHESVYNFTPTLIHGDFHVGNMLFAMHDDDNDGDDENDDENAKEENRDPIWLLDWATCGKGNPLCDFVFFWVVSTKDSDARTLLQQYLPLYYQTLMKHRAQQRQDQQAAIEEQSDGKNDDDRTSSQSDFSYSHCLEMVKTCLLHQFILLVCYDAWTRNFLLETYNRESDQATLQFYQHHFDNVNRRCARAVVSEEMRFFDQLKKNHGG